METIDCNLCGGTDTTTVYHGPALMYAPDETFTLVRCKRCGLMYVNPRPTPDEIGHYYPSTYELHQTRGEEPVRKGKRAAMLALARAWYLGYPLPDTAQTAGALVFTGARLLRRFLREPHWKPKGRVLDVGGATGTFAAHLAELGWKAHMLEPAESAVSIAAQRPGVIAYQGTAETRDFPEASFDAVTMMQVLEHTHDPVGVLRKVRRWLAPGGEIVVAVPNGGSWERAYFGSRWRGLQVPLHLYSFTPKTIREVLKQAGFAVTQFDCDPALNNLYAGWSDLANDGKPGARLMYRLLCTRPALRLRPISGALYATSGLSGRMRVRAIAVDSASNDDETKPEP